MSIQLYVLCCCILEAHSKKQIGNVQTSTSSISSAHRSLPLISGVSTLRAMAFPNARDQQSIATINVSSRLHHPPSAELSINNWLAIFILSSYVSKTDQVCGLPASRSLKIQS